ESPSAWSQKPPPYKPPSISPSDPPLVFNILILGPTQSGKSTFIESTKLYADPLYKINDDRLGNGNESCTSNVHEETVTTCLPIYKLYDLDNDQEVDTFQINTERSFKKLLAREDDIEIRVEEVPDSKIVQFRIFDTPGLNDTNENDIQNIAKIFSALSKVKELHLVLIMDSQGVPLLPSQKSAFKTYFDLFPELKNLMTIVHTHVPNKHRYPEANPKLEAKLSERSNFFKGIASQGVTFKKIDCDLDEKGPVHVWLTRNTIREILKIATIKTPVTMKRTHVHKLKTMTDVDDVVHRKYAGILDATLKACEARGKLSEAAQLALKIEDTKREIEAKKRLISDHDNDDLQPLFEEEFDEGVGFIGWFQDLVGRANEIHSMKFKMQQYNIDRMRVNEQGIEVLSMSGGENHRCWDVRFKRKAFNPGCYHVVLSMTKRTENQDAIKKWKSELDTSNKNLEDQNKEHTTLTVTAQQHIGDPSENLEQLLAKTNKCHMMKDHTAAKILSVDLFLELADSGIYKGSDVDGNALALEKHLVKKFGIDW
ncbi:hypothetical protein BGZ65_009860, partial [Modicella reniformis]